MIRAAPFVVARGLVKRYGALEAVRSVDLAIDPGEIVGIAGPNGSGKSTLARLLLGFARPQRGDAMIDGLTPETYRARVGVGFVPEDRARAWDRATPRQLLALRVPDPEAPPVRLVCDTLGATPLLDRRIDSLSKGQWTTCLAAYAFAANPRWLVLDEADSGLDPAAMERLRLAMSLASASGSTILVLSHHLDELALGVHRLLFFAAGRIRGTMDPRGVGAIELRRAYVDAVEVA